MGNKPTRQVAPAPDLNVNSKRDMAIPVYNLPSDGKSGRKSRRRGNLKGGAVAAASRNRSGRTSGNQTPSNGPIPLVTKSPGLNQPLPTDDSPQDVSGRITPRREERMWSKRVSNVQPAMQDLPELSVTKALAATQRSRRTYTSRQKGLDAKARKAKTQALNDVLSKKVRAAKDTGVEAGKIKKVLSGQASWNNRQFRAAIQELDDLMKNKEMARSEVGSVTSVRSADYTGNEAAVKKNARKRAEQKAVDDAARAQRLLTAEENRAKQVIAQHQIAERRKSSRLDTLNRQQSTHITREAQRQLDAEDKATRDQRTAQLRNQAEQAEADREAQRQAFRDKQAVKRRDEVDSENQRLADEAAEDKRMRDAAATQKLSEAQTAEADREAERQAFRDKQGKLRQAGADEDRVRQLAEAQDAKRRRDDQTRQKKAVADQAEADREAQRQAFRDKQVIHRKATTAAERERNRLDAAEAKRQRDAQAAAREAEADALEAGKEAQRQAFRDKQGIQRRKQNDNENAVIAERARQAKLARDAKTAEMAARSTEEEAQREAQRQAVRDKQGIHRRQANDEENAAIQARAQQDKRERDARAAQLKTEAEMAEADREAQRQAFRDKQTIARRELNDAENAAIAERAAQAKRERDAKATQLKTEADVAEAEREAQRQAFRDKQGVHRKTEAEEERLRILAQDRTDKAARDGQASENFAESTQAEAEREAQRQAFRDKQGIHRRVKSMEDLDRQLLEDMEAKQQRDARAAQLQTEAVAAEADREADRQAFRDKQGIHRQAGAEEDRLRQLEDGQTAKEGRDERGDINRAAAEEAEAEREGARQNFRDNQNWKQYETMQERERIKQDHAADKNNRQDVQTVRFELSRSRTMERQVANAEKRNFQMQTRANMTDIERQKHEDVAAAAKQQRNVRESVRLQSMKVIELETARQREEQMNVKHHKDAQARMSRVEIEQAEMEELAARKAEWDDKLDQQKIDFENKATERRVRNYLKYEHYESSDDEVY